MTENVKSAAYNNLLDQNNKVFGSNDGQFVDADQQILNFARDDVHKNISTQRPTRLYGPLASYVKSIAQISCGSIRGTCWLVSKRLVITNFHIYMMINKEREDTQNPNLPIYVSFDFLHHDPTQGVVTVEVDEEQDPDLENLQLDYKFLCLKEDESLNGRPLLGSIVRGRRLEEGRVIIIGHPGGEEMHEETCVVVSNHSWREKLNARHGAHTGVHMTNTDLLNATEGYKECLPYDTSLFCGASGSPGSPDMNGNIVAMHAQGYVLPTMKGRRCSLMEFGLQFNAICKDIKRKYSENAVEELFPNYNLDTDGQTMYDHPMEVD
ncbi:protein FAM111A-like [Dendronephthya gigantea]|uniref:protein FAM111A-like n=1 Tax=Dendronephthya gigantea TaxID=151771 RepID=UPI00106D048F|nr:protein FAM111A-like [Dendronephthya gigantea]